MCVPARKREFAVYCVDTREKNCLQKVWFGPESSISQILLLMYIEFCLFVSVRSRFFSLLLGFSSHGAGTKVECACVCVSVRVCLYRLQITRKYIRMDLIFGQAMIFSAEHIASILIAYYSRFSTVFIDLFDTFFLCTNEEGVNDNNNSNGT